MLLNIIFALVTLFIIGKIWDLYKKNKRRKELNDPQYLLEIVENKIEELRDKLLERDQYIQKNIEIYSNDDKKENSWFLKNWKENEKYNNNRITKVREVEKLFMSLQAEYSQDQKKLIEIINDFILFLDLHFELTNADSNKNGEDTKLKIDQLVNKFEKLLSNSN